MGAERSKPRRLAFYRRLDAEQKREYDRSDARTTLPLRPSATLGEAGDEVVRALAAESPARVRRAAQRLVDEICSNLAAQSRRRHAETPPRVKVLRTRPRAARSEFHGLYTRFDGGSSEIKVWMLTAAHGKVVRPRTFLRTLLHEICHHVDTTLLYLPRSLHTLGFHARESSLLRALEQSGATVPGGRRVVQGQPPHSKPKPEPRSAPSVQLELFRQPSVRSSTGRRGGRAD
jgi:hypothetical protein